MRLVNHYYGLMVLYTFFGSSVHESCFLSHYFLPFHAAAHASLLPPTSSPELSSRSVSPIS